MKEIIAYAFLSVYTILEFVAYIPQIIKILKTRHADDLSLTSWFVWITTDLSYLGYVLLETPEVGVIFIATRHTGFGIYCDRILANRILSKTQQT